MISAFGVNHGEISKGLFKPKAAKSITDIKLGGGYNKRGAGLAYAPSRDRAVSGKKWSLEDKKKFYEQKNHYLKTGKLPK